MVRKTEEWISSTEALDIINTNSGRTDLDHRNLYLLVKHNKVQKRRFDGRTFEYKKSDVLHVTVKTRRKKEDNHVTP